jgi:hypothetical protein
MLRARRRLHFLWCRLLGNLTERPFRTNAMQIGYLENQAGKISSRVERVTWNLGKEDDSFSLISRLAARIRHGDGVLVADLSGFIPYPHAKGRFDG